jgi:hypothetical protein
MSAVRFCLFESSICVVELNTTKEVNDMTMEVREEEKKVICHALNVYLKDLRGEITKTEKHDMKVDLHREEDLIKDFIARC